MTSDMNSKLHLLLDRIYETASEEETIRNLLKHALERTDNDKEMAVSYLSENLQGISESMDFISGLAQNLSLILVVEEFGYKILREMKILIAIMTLRGHNRSSPATKKLIISAVTGAKDRAILEKIIKGDS